MKSCSEESFINIQKGVKIMSQLCYVKLIEQLEETLEEEERAIKVMKFQVAPEKRKNYAYYSRIAARACAKKDLLSILYEVEDVFWGTSISQIKLKLITSFKGRIEVYVFYKVAETGFVYDNNENATIQSGLTMCNDPVVVGFQNTIFQNVMNKIYLQTFNEFLKVECKSNKKVLGNQGTYYEHCWGCNGSEEILISVNQQRED